MWAIMSQYSPYSAWYFRYNSGQPYMHKYSRAVRRYRSLGRLNSWGQSPIWILLRRWMNKHERPHEWTDNVSTEDSCCVLLNRNFILSKTRKAKIWRWFMFANSDSDITDCFVVIYSSRRLINLPNPWGNVSSFMHPLSIKTCKFWSLHIE
jgi:hypothetical protein